MWAALRRWARQIRIETRVRYIERPTRRDWRELEDELAEGHWDQWKNPHLGE